MIVAPARSSRPRSGAGGGSGAGGREADLDQLCPFCPGNESHTAKELFRLPAASEGPWRVRVVANLYPALIPRAGGQARSPERDSAEGSQGRNFGEAEPSHGRHEVIVETPVHDRALVDFDDGELGNLLRVYQARFAEAAADESVRHIVIFRNQGTLANASIPHPHTQLAALGFVPPTIGRTLRRARRYHAKRGTALLHDLVDWEIERRVRLVDAGPRFAALVPFAPMHDHELWVVPRVPPDRFDRVESRTLLEFGRALRRGIATVNASLDRPDFNFVLQTPPLVENADSMMPWYAQIIPRREVRAGFEMGIGVQVTSTVPEDAAATYREGTTAVAGA